MFDFDICAPHITVPECFTDENSMMVVFDLGRLQFRNLCPKLMSDAASEQKQSPDDEGMVSCWHYLITLLVLMSHGMLLNKTNRNAVIISVIMVVLLWDIGSRSRRFERDQSSLY